MRQLRSAGIEVFHIPFATIADVFRKKGLEIDYPERSTATQKAKLNRALERASEPTLDELSSTLAKAIRKEYKHFESRLYAAVTEKPVRVRIVTLYGEETTYFSVAEALQALETHEVGSEQSRNTPRGYEVFLEYPTGSRVDGRFQDKAELIQFLKQVGA